MWLKRFGSSIFHFDLGLESELTPDSDESLIAVAGINHSLDSTECAPFCSE